jgi:hypothetical protein
MRQLANYIVMQHRTERELAAAFRRVADAHANDPDVYYVCHTFGSQAE